ncbi:hypothetical protein Pcac1_g12665 [Phytophthora cactorum]|nr:hypothetical protein Pcac1_g12665 [Phytophthora cactorum]
MFGICNGRKSSRQLQMREYESSIGSTHIISTLQ